MDAPRAPQPGTVIAEKYRVERILGQGGMGVVLEATHVSLGKRVALKVLRVDAADEQARQRFAREARIAAQLPAEHVAAVSDFGQTSAGEPYLVMEMLVGNDLQKELLARGPLPIEEAVDLVLQGGEGVADAHAAGLVHRDLKPSNLFLVRRRDNSPLVKVLDFGLTKMTNEAHADLTATEATMGTPQYMSPEQIRSAKYVDARTDQHALAMILYELVMGTPPYKAESVTGLYVVISTAPPAPMRAHRADVPAGLEAAVLRALAKDPEARFPDLAAFAAAVAPFGGPGALASARRMAAAFGRELPAPAQQPVAVREPAHVAHAEQPAPRPEQDTHSALAGAPARPSSLGAKVALAAGAGVVAVLGAAFVALRVGPGSASTAEPVPTAVPASTTVPAPTAAPAAVVAPAPALSAAEPMAPGTAVPEAQASSSGPENVPSASRPLRPPPTRPGRKAVDPASNVFGERRK